MQSIRQVERLNQAELEKCVPSNASWHTDYRDTAYIYIGGLPFELSEGDILIIFSQYGNPVHINLVRDKETGKSRGFCFLKYEDQRSCDLAVDNLSGATVLGRMMSVDHTRYKKKEGEVETVGDEELLDDADETDREDQGSRKRRRALESASEDEKEARRERPKIKEEIELERIMREHDDDDPMKAYLIKEKKEEVAEALKALARRKTSDRPRDRGEERGHRHRRHHDSHRHRSHRDRSEDEQDRERERDRRRERRHRDDDDDNGERESRRSGRSGQDRERQRDEDRSSRRKEDDDMDVDAAEHMPRRDRRDRRDRSRTPTESEKDGRHRRRIERGRSSEDGDRRR